MSDETKTVSSGLDLYANQCRDVSNMRASLLSCNKNDPDSARKAIQYITVQRVYHQISRIIRFTELMDSIEDKMYESIETDLNNMDTADSGTWKTLLALQSKLQESMIESHKLLEPYLKLETLTSVELPKDDPNDTFTAMILDQQSREKLRTSAQEVLAAISAVDDSNTERTKEKPTAQSAAQEALKHIEESEAEVVTDSKKEETDSQENT